MTIEMLDPSLFASYSEKLRAKTSPKGRTIEQFYDWFRKYSHAHSEYSGEEYHTTEIHLTFFWGMAQAIKRGQKPSDYILEFFDSIDPNDFDVPISYPQELKNQLDKCLADRLPGWPRNEEGVAVIPEQDREPFEIILIPAGTKNFPGHATISVLPTLNGFRMDMFPNGPASEFKSFMVRADTDGLPVDDNPQLPYASRTTRIMENGKESQIADACGHDTHRTLLAFSDLICLEYPELLRGPQRSQYEPAEETFVPMYSPDKSYCAEAIPVSGAVYGARFGALNGVGATLGYHNRQKNEEQPAGTLGIKSGRINTAALISETTVRASITRGAAAAASTTTSLAARLVTDLWPETAAQISARQRAAKPFHKRLSQRFSRGRRRPVSNDLVVAISRVKTVEDEYGPAAVLRATPRHYHSDLQNVMPQILLDAADNVRRKEEKRERRREGWLRKVARATNNDPAQRRKLTVTGDQLHGSRPHEGVYAVGHAGHLTVGLPDEVGARFTAASLANQVNWLSQKVRGREVSPERVSQWRRRFVRPARGGRAIARGIGLGNKQYLTPVAFSTPEPDGPANVLPDQATVQFDLRVPETLTGIRDTVMHEAWCELLKRSQWKKLDPQRHKIAESALDIAALHTAQPADTSPSASEKKILAPDKTFTTRAKIHMSNTRLTTVINNHSGLVDHLRGGALARGVEPVEVAEGAGSDTDCFNNGDDGKPGRPEIPHAYVFITRSEGGNIHSAGCDAQLDDLWKMADFITYARLTAHDNPSLRLRRPRNEGEERRPYDDTYIKESFFTGWTPDRPERTNRTGAWPIRNRAERHTTGNAHTHGKLKTQR